MKVCPKCAQSFAEGFKYCPRDATELVKYDVRARMQSQEELHFLLESDSLWSRLKSELAEARVELRRRPLEYLASLLRSEGSSHGRRRLLQAGWATSVIVYSLIVLAFLTAGFLKMAISGNPADAAPPPLCDPSDKYVKLVFTPVEERAEQGRGMLGGSLSKPKRSHGGGGAKGDLRASAGEMPTPSLNPQINPPDLSLPKIIQPKLVVPETVYVDPAFWRTFKGPYGERGGQIEIPSLGSGVGTGVGPGKGPGSGQGEDGNTGGGRPASGGGPITGPDNETGSAISKLKPTILHTERASYTEEARQQRVQGSVVLNVLFGADGRIQDIRTLHGLPHGLTESAIAAAHRIRFRPAVRNGQPVGVRLNIEFNFALY
jgi:TonB family protein